MLPVIPTQTRWVIRGFVGLAIAAASFGSGWAVNGWRLDAAHQAEAAERSRAQVRQLETQAAQHARDQATMQRSSMRNSPSRPATLAAWLLLAVMLMGCATGSEAPFASGPGFRIPSPPASSEPKPPGSYWAMVCAYKQSLQERLNLSLPTFGPCADTSN